MKSQSHKKSLSFSLILVLSNIYRLIVNFVPSTQMSADVVRNLVDQLKQNITDTKLLRQLVEECARNDLSQQQKLTLWDFWRWPVVPAQLLLIIIDSYTVFERPVDQQQEQVSTLEAVLYIAAQCADSLELAQNMIQLQFPLYLNSILISVNSPESIKAEILTLFIQISRYPDLQQYLWKNELLSALVQILKHYKAEFIPNVLKLLQIAEETGFLLRGQDNLLFERTKGLTLSLQKFVSLSLKQNGSRPDVQRNVGLAKTLIAKIQERSK